MTAPYFSRNDVQRLIRQLASSRTLTIVTGAGASADWGIPGWGVLVERLLAEVAERMQPDDTAFPPAFARQVLSSNGIVGGATIARLMLGEDHFGRALGSALYRDARSQFGPTAQTLARLFLEWRRGKVGAIRFVTTNYDTSLEDALHDLSASPEWHAAECGRVVSIASADEATASFTEDDALVFHLHGRLGSDSAAPAGDLVFTEADYALGTGMQNWQTELLETAFGGDESQTLFIGMSLTDPNVLAHLYRFRNERVSGSPPIVVVPAQGSTSSGETSATRDFVDRVARERLEEIGVRVSSPDYFSQVPQLLEEVILCKRIITSSGDATAGIDVYEERHRYGRRLADWYRAMRERPLTSAHASIDPTKPTLEVARFTEDTAEFAHVQRENQAALFQLRRLLFAVARLTSDGVERKDERFAVQLWARDVSNRQLELWGSSERSWAEPKSTLRVDIERDSPYHAVRAFCTGFSAIEPTAKPGSRWALSVCRVLHADIAAPRLPVGVIALESNRAPTKSVLRALNPTRLDGLLQLLEVTGRLLLRPAADAGPLSSLLERLELDVRDRLTPIEDLTEQLRLFESRRPSVS